MLRCGLLSVRNAAYTQYTNILIKFQTKRNMKRRRAEPESRNTPKNENVFARIMEYPLIFFWDFTLVLILEEVFESHLFS